MFRLRATALIFGLWPILAAPQSHAEIYQEYRDGVCAANAECDIDFPEVPAGKILRVSNLSCYLRTPRSGSGQSGVVAAQLVVMRVSDGKRILAITPSLAVQENNVTVGSLTEQVHVSNDIIDAVAKPGQRVRTYAIVNKNSDGTRGTVSQLSCHISGTLD